MSLRTFTLTLALLAAVPASARPSLAVLVVVDQLRAADVDRLAPLFGPGGFGGFGRRGAHVDLRYAYAVTETGPGHATISTGANPSVHGIAANRWWVGTDRTYCVFDPDARIVGAPDAAGLGPANLRAGTLADAVKAASLGRGRVVTLSHKDRAAILTGGFGADVAAWYDPDLGRFATSTHYSDELPEWLGALATRRVGRSLEGRVWKPLPTPKQHRWLLPADDHNGEDARLGGRTFPHDLAAVADAEKRKRDYRGTPAAMADLFVLATAALEHERLGADDAPDLLVIGVSSADYVGHWFGPDSAEMVDMLRRLDRHLRSLTQTLDERYGRDGYVLAVTGDHGGLPLPERTAARRLPGGRIDARALFDAAEDAVASALPDAERKKRLVGYQAPHIWMDLEDLSPEERRRALAAASRSLAAHEGIAGAWPSDELRADDDPFARELLEARHAGRTGQLFVRPAPRWFVDYVGTGTDHGSPYAYDRRVPLFLVGEGVSRGRYAREADPRDVAPTLSWLLGVPPPDAAQGRPVHFVLRTR